MRQASLAKTCSRLISQYLLKLLTILRTTRPESVDPLQVLTKTEPLTDALDAYKKFDQRGAGWMKVKLETTH